MIRRKSREIECVLKTIMEMKYYDSFYKSDIYSIQYNKTMNLANELEKINLNNFDLKLIFFVFFFFH